MPHTQDRHEERRNMIREILETQAIHSQGALVEALRDRGYEVSQSSVSRDLGSLGVVRIEGRYLPSEAVAAPAAPARNTALEALAEALVAVERMQAAGPHLLVLHTPPGRAPVVSLTLDEAGLPEVVGTVAGDDTVFVATAGRRQQQKLEARLSGLGAGSSRT